MNYPAKTSWHVYTTSEIHDGMTTMRPVWAWVAHGPEGAQTGTEASGEAAVHKARAAALVLSDATSWSKP